MTPIARLDDGRLSCAYLQTKAAHRVHFETEEQRTVLLPVGNARKYESTEPGIYDLISLQDHNVGTDEEDPFGHGALLDETQAAPTGACGHAALEGGLAQSVATVAVDAGNGPGMHHQEAVSVATPSSLAPREVADDVLPGAHTTHVLTRTAHVVWCRVCGRHAVVRLGVGLQRPCVGIAVGAHPARIERLRSRKHPVTGFPLCESTLIDTNSIASTSR